MQNTQYNKNDLLEVGLWLSGKYKHGTGSSSNFILKVALGVNPEEIQIAYPYDTSDALRCFELISNCRIVKEALDKIKTIKIYGIIPIYKELFDLPYNNYINNMSVCWDASNYFTNISYIQKLCEDNNILPTIHDRGIEYIFDNQKYMFNVNGCMSSYTITTQDEKNEILNLMKLLDEEATKLHTRDYYKLNFDDIKTFYNLSEELEKKSELMDRTNPETSSLFLKNNNIKDMMKKLNKHPDIENWKKEVKKIS